MRGRQRVILPLDVKNDEGAFPAQRVRDDEADAFAGARRADHEDVLVVLHTKKIAADTSEDDAALGPEPFAPGLQPRHEAGVAEHVAGLPHADGSDEEADCRQGSEGSQPRDALNNRVLPVKERLLQADQRVACHEAVEQRRVLVEDAQELGVEQGPEDKRQDNREDRLEKPSMPEQSHARLSGLTEPIEGA